MIVMRACISLYSLYTACIFSALQLYCIPSRSKELQAVAEYGGERRLPGVPPGSLAPLLTVTTKPTASTLPFTFQGENPTAGYERDTMERICVHSGAAIDVVVMDVLSHTRMTN